MGRCVRLAALVLMIALGLGGVACFVMLAGAETPVQRAVDATLFLLLVAATCGLGFLVWPRGAR